MQKRRLGIQAALFHLGNDNAGKGEAHSVVLQSQPEIKSQPLSVFLVHESNPRELIPENHVEGGRVKLQERSHELNSRGRELSHELSSSRADLNGTSLIVFGLDLQER